MSLKAWVADIEQHVVTWSQHLRNAGHGWWPRYVYHYTDVQNAAKIIETGCIYSRAEAERLGLMIRSHLKNHFVTGS
jgi:hypothetical protein